MRRCWSTPAPRSRRGPGWRASGSHPRRRAPGRPRPRGRGARRRRQKPLTSTSLSHLQARRRWRNASGSVGELLVPVALHVARVAGAPARPVVEPQPLSPSWPASRRGPAAPRPRSRHRPSQRCDCNTPSSFLSAPERHPLVADEERRVGRPTASRRDARSAPPLCPPPATVARRTTRRHRRHNRPQGRTIGKSRSASLTIYDGSRRHRVPTGPGPRSPAVLWAEAQVEALCALFVRVDIDPPPRQARSEPGILALPADGQVELVVGYARPAPTWRPRRRRYRQTWAGDSAWRTNSGRIVDQSTMSIFSPWKPAMTARTRGPSVRCRRPWR